MSPTILVSLAVAFFLAGLIFRRSWTGLSSILFTVALGFALLSAALVSVEEAHGATVAHANGMENRMLVLTDDKCAAPTGAPPGAARGRVAIVLSFYKQAHSDAPGYIVADGCWTKESDMTVVIVWNPEGYAMTYRADQFHWKGAK